MSGNTIKVDSPVMVMDKSMRGCMETVGICGIVKMLHEDCGACVELYISRIFAPYFWYPQSILETVDSIGLFGGMAYDVIERALGGRGKVSMYNNPISDGCLRSWFINRTRALPDQSLDIIIRSMSWMEMNNIYMDTSDKTFEKWLITNDTRPRRPQMLKIKDLNWLEDSVSIKRPKMF